MQSVQYSVNTAILVATNQPVRTPACAQNQLTPTGATFSFNLHGAAGATDHQQLVVHERLQPPQRAVGLPLLRGGVRGGGDGMHNPPLHLQICSEHFQECRRCARHRRLLARCQKLRGARGYPGVGTEYRSTQHRRKLRTPTLRRENHQLQTPSTAVSLNTQ
jgi:hypothetical protein